MSEVSTQYEAFPYPERDPKDEAKRLIVGSPSHPLEIDHFLFGGRRDWTRSIRILVAGGGTGDGLIQLAQMLTDAKRPYDITYLDLSVASRKIAEARAAQRNLTNIRFLTGNLLDAPLHGPFDYVDCCGVLHHLPEPVEGFKALAQAIEPDGGIGFMVYAPYGRSGVYPLQEAFNTLFAHLPPIERLKAAKQAFKNLPDAHPFRRNLNLVDHVQSEAGFYDLLLHSQDQAFDVARLLKTIADAGLELVSFVETGQYEVSPYSTFPDGLKPEEQWALGEKLAGTIKTHIGYLARAGSGKLPATGNSNELVPHLKPPAQKLAQVIAAGKSPKLTSGGVATQLRLPKNTASLIFLVDGKRSLNQISTEAGVDPILFGTLWSKIHTALAPWGQLHYSKLLVK